MAWLDLADAKSFKYPDEAHPQDEVPRNYKIDVYGKTKGCGDSLLEK